MYCTYVLNCDLMTKHLSLILCDFEERHSVLILRSKIMFTMKEYK